MKFGITTKAIASIPPDTPVAIVGPDEHDGLFRIYTTTMETARTTEEFFEETKPSRIPSVERLQLLSLEADLPTATQVATAIISAGAFPQAATPYMLNALSVIAESELESVAAHLMTIHLHLGEACAMILEFSLTKKQGEALELHYKGASKAVFFLRQVFQAAKHPPTSSSITQKELDAIRGHVESMQKLSSILRTLGNLLGGDQ